MTPTNDEKPTRTIPSLGNYNPSVPRGMALALVGGAMVPITAADAAGLENWIRGSEEDARAVPPRPTAAHTIPLTFGRSLVLTSPAGLAGLLYGAADDETEGA